jgi:pimeloyl-ACP methyl ester carboxylesterase
LRRRRAWQYTTRQVACYRTILRQKPLIVTHGWPGSVIEQLKIIEPLTNPTAHGANASDAFHLVIPSLPGYGFSAKPTTNGWGPDHIARAWVVLMKRLGYTQFVAQGATGVRLFQIG